MLRRERAWLETQERSGDGRVKVRLDSASIRALEDRDCYYVVIDGFNLYPRISPPVVTVGGVLMEQIQYEENGRRIEGVLKKEPSKKPVTIDYGYAHAELKGEIWV